MFSWVWFRHFYGLILSVLVVEFCMIYKLVLEQVSLLVEYEFHQLFKIKFNLKKLKVRLNLKHLAKYRGKNEFFSKV